MVVMDDLGILNWLKISPCDCPDFCKSRMDEIASFEYLRLEPLGLEGII